MRKISYKYKNPLNNGYTKVSKNKYKEIIPHYKSKAKYEVYENEECYLIHQFEPFYLVILSIILLPIWFLLYGVFGMKEVFETLYSNIFQKHTGSFISEIIFKDKSLKIE